MDDHALLQLFIEQEDAAAFAELTRRHLPLVIHVCRSVLRNAHDAEDVAQECLLELARDARQVHTSVAGWLHRAATTRSLNLLRSRSRRRIRERNANSTTSVAVSDTSEQELQTVIRGALTEMPDDLRVPMLLHFFDGRSQRDVATELGVNQSTISRRMRDALCHLRERLTRAGFAASVPALWGTLHNQSEAADRWKATPDCSATSSTVAGVSWWTALQWGRAALVPTVVSLMVDGWISLVLAALVAVYFACRSTRVGMTSGDNSAVGEVESPLSVFSRFRWSEPPRDWPSQAVSSIGWSLLFLLFAAVFVAGTRQTPWGTVLLAVSCSVVFGMHGLRIWRRVRRLRSITSTEHRPTAQITRHQDLVKATPSSRRLSVTEGIGLTLIGLLAVAVSIHTVFSGRAASLWPAITVSFVTGANMLWWGICTSLTQWHSRQQEVTSQTSADSCQHSPTLLNVSATLLVVGISLLIIRNLSAVGHTALALAAVQSAMLGWAAYRTVSRHRLVSTRRWQHGLIAILVACVLLNTGVCLASCLQ